MTPDRWRQITEIFHAALARDASARDGFLRDACQDDPSLRKEVDALVAAHGEAGSFGSDPLLPDSAPRLLRGTRLGTYQIAELLGVGGMGEVYRAYDTELGRQVAIKVLPGAWLSDPDRRARLDKEARVLAALNHPQVAAIHGVVEADGVRGLVLELVEGVTLAERLSEGPLSLTEALTVAVQLADALDATHEKGIIHRDLKPANVKITPDGGIKVLDFGVAKVRRSEVPFNADHEPPTSTAGQTGDDVIIGTAAYMSPEQARGKPVDKRADIWAFGCVLYEMLSGRRPFVGETTTDVLTAIIHREPEWNALPAGVPLPVRHVLERCLEKDPKRRLRDIGDARVELEQSLESTQGGKVITRESPPPVRRPRRWPTIAAALLVVAVALLSWQSIPWRLSRRPPEPTVVPLTTYPGTEWMPSLSPDGNYVAFQWNGEAEDTPDIYVKLVGPGDPIRLTKDPVPELLPTWSPDGTQIAFLREEGEPGAIPPSNATLTLTGLQYRLGVYVIPALGGTARRVGDATVPSLAWADSRTLVISRSPAANQPAGLATLSIETGQVSQLTSPAAPPFDRLAAVSPDGESVAFQRVLGPPSVWALMLVSLSRSSQAIREPREVDINQTLVGGGLGQIAWSADGREIIYAAGWGLSFLWRIAPSENSQPVRLTFAGEAAGQPTTSRSGSRLVFSRSLAELNIWSLELDEGGRAKGPPAQVFDSSRWELCPAFSPDGTRVAFQSNRSSINAVWTCRSNGSDCSRVAQLAGAHTGSPAWSPDSQWIAFDRSETKGSAIYIVRSDGGQVQRLADGVVPRWSRDGRWIYYVDNRQEGLYRVSSTGGNPESVSGTAGGVVAEESPDRQWIYYSGAPVTAATRLRRVPSRGGQATDVLPEQISGRNFAVAEAGIWYLTPSPGVKEGSLLRFFDFASKTTRTVYRTEHPVGPGLTLAPNGRRILFTQQDRRGSDLMLVENFR